VLAVLSREDRSEAVAQLMVSVAEPGDRVCRIDRPSELPGRRESRGCSR
jgi:hypothetical protein